MKTKSFLLLATILTVIGSLFGCQNDDATLTEPVPEPESQQHVYRMRFAATLSSYDTPVTRSTAHLWQEGEKVYLVFVVGQQSVTGVATYRATDDEWTLTTNATLPDTEDGQCFAACFFDEQRTTQTSVTLDRQSRAYYDAAGSYIKVEDVLTVQSTLLPQTARLRFRGTAGQQATVSGLRFLTAYDLRNHEFSSAAGQLAVTVGADGYSPYAYALFADDSRQLTSIISDKAAWRRSFGANVLTAGTSGYITLPTTASHEGWTLVNLTNQQPITLPTLSKATVNSITHKSATLTATVSQLGNGTLEEVGFVVSMQHNPTLADTKLGCATSTSISGRITNLQPLTIYYVRAYATNEAGTAYSAEETMMTTKAEPDDTSFEIEDFDEDSQWDNQ